MAEITTCPIDCDALAVGEIPHWPINRLSWRNLGVSYPKVDFANGMDYVAEMLKKHQVNLFLDIVTENVGTHLESHPMPLNESDGPGGMLAYARLPDRWTTANTTLISAFDRAEGQWMTQKPGETVIAHELCHNFGLRHYDGAPDLMNRRLNDDMHSDWGQWTETTLRSLYGKRGGKQEPTCAFAQLCPEIANNFRGTYRRFLVELRRMGEQ